MTADVEGDAVGPAAHDCNVLGRGSARRLWQLHGIGGNVGLAGPEPNFQFGVPRDSTHGGAEHAL